MKFNLDGVKPGDIVKIKSLSARIVGTPTKSRRIGWNVLVGNKQLRCQPNSNFISLQNEEIKFQDGPPWISLCSPTGTKIKLLSPIKLVIVG